MDMPWAKLVGQIAQAYRKYRCPSIAIDPRLFT
jgi:hypothetical protein